jgi:hypothetical protein
MSLTLLFLVGCAVQSAKPAPMPSETITRVEFRFHDSSVPPPDHRSYIISVSATEVSRVTDSYGDVTADERRAGSPDDLAAAVKAFQTAELALGKDRDYPGCTGGTGKSVATYSNEKQAFSGYAGRCGGERTGPLKGDVDGFGKRMAEIAGL